jgi:hypothetical protein
MYWINNNQLVRTPSRLPPLSPIAGVLSYEVGAHEREAATGLHIIIRDPAGLRSPWGKGTPPKISTSHMP